MFLDHYLYWLYISHLLVIKTELFQKIFLFQKFLIDLVLFKYYLYLYIFLVAFQTLQNISLF